MVLLFTVIWMILFMWNLYATLQAYEKKSATSFILSGIVLGLTVIWMVGYGFYYIMPIIENFY